MTLGRLQSIWNCWFRGFLLIILKIVINLLIITLEYFTHWFRFALKHLFWLFLIKTRLTLIIKITLSKILIFRRYAILIFLKLYWIIIIIVIILCRVFFLFIGYINIKIIIINCTLILNLVYSIWLWLRWYDFRII